MELIGKNVRQIQQRETREQWKRIRRQTTDSPTIIVAVR